jgi:serine/threonine protein kinase
VRRLHFSGFYILICAPAITFSCIPRTGSLPFDNDNISLLLASVSKGDFTIPKDVDEDVADLIRGMLTVDVEKRIKLGQVRNHSCFAGTSHFDGAPPAELLADPKISAVGQAPLEETIIADLASLGWGEPTNIREKVCATVRAHICFLSSSVSPLALFDA